jgi:hypothetical protein
MVTFLAVAVAAISTVTCAQEPPSGAAALVVHVVPSSGLAADTQEPPEGDGAWVVQIVTRGGFAGRGRGNFTISSDGRLTCSRPGCPGSVPADRVRQIGNMIAVIEAAAWLSQPKSTCSDCYETMVTVRRRQGGHVIVDVARWDDSQRVSPQIRSVSEAVIVLSAGAAR